MEKEIISICDARDLIMEEMQYVFSIPVLEGVFKALGLNETYLVKEREKDKEFLKSFGPLSRNQARDICSSS